MCRRKVCCNSGISVLWVSISISFNQFLNSMGVVPRAPITSGITLTFMLHIFSTLVSSLGNVLFFLIVCCRPLHQKGKQNLLSGKDFYPFVPQWHLVISNIFHDQFVLCSPIVYYVYHIARIKITFFKQRVSIIRWSFSS